MLPANAEHKATGTGFDSDVWGFSNIPSASVASMPTANTRGQLPITTGDAGLTAHLNDSKKDSVVHPTHATANSNESRKDSIVETHDTTEGKDVRVQLHYLKDDPFYNTNKPLQVVPDWLDDRGQTNVKLVPGEEEVMHDVRGRESDFSLDEHGFKYVKASTLFKDWSSQPQIAKVHLPELEELLRQEVEGADEILFYDARLRQETDTGVKVSGLSYKPFARQVHTDNTESSVIEKIYNLTDMKADYYLQGRVRIINIWRPIKHPVYDCGLAVANGAKLRDTDIIECQRVRADTGRNWDTMGVIKYREGFEWHYMSLQDEPDVLLFKNYDSAIDVKAKCCLHTAFDLPAEDIPAGAPTRESIEVRALVFTRPQGIRRPSTLGMLQHPLATQLEGSQLPLVDEDRCITDTVRDDIDEGGEMKDAMLLLRRKEAQRLTALNASLHGNLRASEAQCAALLTTLRTTSAALESQKSHNADLRAQVAYLQARLDRPPTALEAEVERLVAYNAGLEREIVRWRGEATGRGGRAVSESWRASVGEAVGREREKDGVVLMGRDEEIARLRGEVERLKVELGREG